MSASSGVHDSHEFHICLKQLVSLEWFAHEAEYAMLFAARLHLGKARYILIGTVKIVALSWNHQCDSELLLHCHRHWRKNTHLLLMEKLRDCVNLLCPAWLQMEQRCFLGFFGGIVSVMSTSRARERTFAKLWFPNLAVVNTKPRHVRNRAERLCG